MSLHIIHVIVLVSAISTSLCNLESQLHYYESLNEGDILIHSVSKRSAGSSPIKDVTVNAFSKSFHLVLKKYHDFLSPDFKITTVNRRGVEKPVFVDQNDFYTGYVQGEVDSSVEAYWEEGVLSANIRTHDNEYTIEPSWRHIPDHNYTMVAYRASDIRPDPHGKYVPSYCESIRAEGGTVVPSDNSYSHSYLGDLPYTLLSNHSYHSRKKRSVASNACPLMLVADNKFFQAIGGNSAERTARYLMNQIAKVNAIYSTTTFKDGYVDMHLEVKSIRIHEESHPTSPKHYNAINIDWQTKDLLEHFSKYQHYEQYCLVHLFTHQTFDRGVLGLAYIASPRSNNVGGICTNLYDKGGERYSLNTGWSSSLNSFGNTLLSQQAYLVTAHELGHNWGSEHDPDICAPSAEDNGKFLMYPYAVAGYDSNNKKFSSCSIGYISPVLASKSHKCFQPKLSHYCGNGHVEGDGGERCDAGYSGTLDKDPCCSRDCQLKPGASCSSYNDGCCTNCQVSPVNTVCYRSTANDLTCKGDAKCDGSSSTCPDRVPKADNSSCGDSGRCMNGVCKPYCETIGKEPCACDIEAESCKWCCRVPGSKCQPEPTKQGQNLEDGLPCVTGYCETGVCKKIDKNLVVRLWDIIEKITVDKLIEFMRANIVGTIIVFSLLLWIRGSHHHDFVEFEFMRANIVGTIIVFSLLLWIPGSITISCLDKRREKKDKEKKEWLNARDRLFLRPEEAASFRLQNVPAIHRRVQAGSVIRGGGDGIMERSPDKHTVI